VTAVLHLAPHPDDELLGAPATLMALRDAGHRVLNLACSLGAPDAQARRRRELGAALRLADLEGRVLEPPLAISSQDDLQDARHRLAGTVRELVLEEGFDVVVAPSHHDGHHGHEVVGRAAADAVLELPDAPRLWFWGLWADLPLPNLFVPFGEDRLAEILRALAAHEGEVSRNDYAAAYQGRARAARVLGVERIFGFGEPKPDGPYAFLTTETSPYAELLTELQRAADGWYLSSPRVLDARDPLPGADADVPIGWWLDEPSVRERRQRAEQR
jgi:LmbE family N-acetylglucosaminyl deacetylase